MADQYHFDPDTYLQMVEAEVPAYRELQQRIAGFTEGRPVRRILDLGAGTGETAAVVLAVHPGAELVGIDESAAMLEVARERLPNADLRVQRLEEPPPEGPFELVISALAIHHLDGPGKARLFKRIAAVLTSGGCAVVGDVVIPDDPADVVTPIDGVYDKPSSVSDQLQWLSEAGLRATLGWQHRDLAILVAERR